MIRCSRCLYPISKPDLEFDEQGVCAACRTFERRASINWDAKLAELRGLLSDARGHGGPYDVVVPVSGGKDSTYQVLRLLELGARVLAVNAATDMVSKIGRRNLDNLKRFCDVIEWTPNTETRKKLVRLGLFRVGDLSWPEHCAIWAAPTRVAVQFGIPLVVWGEQPQREYSSLHLVKPTVSLNAKWVAEFGGLLGMRLGDVVGDEEIVDEDLEPYRFPADDIMDHAGVKGIWLGDYIEWDGWKNAFVAQQHGWECLPYPVEQSLANFENLDNYITVPRDWLRFVKYGYGRATDIACNLIRRGRLSRDEGLALIKLRERFPWTSLGKPLDEVLDYFGITVREFVDECDRWTNRAIFQTNSSSDLVKDDDGTPRFVEAGDNLRPCGSQDEVSPLHREDDQHSEAA